MFLGHCAVGFATKRAAPQASLGVLVTAPYLLDLVWPIFLLAGCEEVRIEPGNTAVTPLAFVHYPISHSLATAAGWGILFGLLYWACTRYRAGAVVIAVSVVSHWFLDAVVHRPDLPLYPGSATWIGLGLWNSLSGTLIVEGAMFVLGVWIYASMTGARDRAGRYGLWSFVVFLLLAYAANVGGSPPPSSRSLALVGLSTWLLPLWVAWFDRHRAVKMRAAIE